MKRKREKKKRNRRQNPVSKHMHKFNKAAVFRDRKHNYKRKNKNNKESIENEEI